MGTLRCAQRGRWALLAAALFAACAAPPQAPHAPTLYEFELPFGRYAIRPLSVGWVLVPDARDEYPDADLVLFHTGEQLLVLVFTTQGAHESLDPGVLARRNQISEHYEILEFEEERHFRGGARFVPVSVARYRVREHGTNENVWLVSAIVRESTLAVEFLALGGAPTQSAKLVEDLATGLSAPDERAATP